MNILEKGLIMIHLSLKLTHMKKNQFYKNA